MSSRDPGRSAGEKNYRYQLESVEVLENGQAIHSPMIRKYFDWWESFGPCLPSIADFDAFPYPDLEPNLFKVEMLYAGRFRFMGRGRMAAKILGGSNLGVEISAHVRDGDSQLAKEHERLARYYDTVALNLQCSRCAGTLQSINFMDVGFESLDSPIGNADGTVTHIIGIIDTDPSNLLQDEESYL